jgi:uncharacterized protein
MRFATFLVRNRWLVLLVLAMVTAGALALLPQIRFDFTPEAVFRGGDDLVTYSESFKEAFGYNDAILLVVLESTGPTDALSAEALTWQGRVAERIAALSRIERVEAIATLQIPRLRLKGPPWITAEPLIAKLPVDADTEAGVRKAVDDLKLLDEALISVDRRVSSLVANVDPAANDVAAMRHVVRAVTDILDNAPPPPGYAVHLSGLPALRVDIVDNLRDNLIWLFPAAGLLFLIVLGLEFRRISGTILPLLAVGVGLAWTVATLVLRGESFNIISNILPVLLFVIGIANCVHVINRYAEESERLGGDTFEATRRTIAHMSVACFLTFLTTGIGFSTLLGAHSQQLQALGWHAITGMALLYVTTITVLGALLPMFRAPRHTNSTSSRIHPVARIVGFAGHAVARRPRVTLGLSLLLICVFLWFAHGVVANSRMFETYEEGHPPMRALRLIESKLGGILPLEVSLTSDTDEQFLQPDTYRRVARAQQAAARLDTVLFARSYVDLHQEIHAKMTRRDELRSEMPADSTAGQQRLQTHDAILRSIASASQYDTFVTADGRRARIMLRVRDVGSNGMLSVLDNLNKMLAEVFPPETGIRTRLTGDAQIHSRAMTSFVRDLITSLLGASLVIFFVIGLLFRSLRIGLIAILPNITPLVLTWGYIGMRGYEMNAGNVVVFAISLGIAVDNTIHFLARFREEVQLDANIPEAIRRSYHGTGRAIVLTSVLIVTGLSVLLLSEFVPSRRFAELTNVTIAGALVGDLFLLPACLMLFWKSPRRNDDGMEITEKAEGQEGVETQGDGRAGNCRLSIDD